MSKRKSNPAVIASIIAIAIIGVIVLSFVIMNYRANKQMASIINTISDNKAAMTTGIKQDTYSYIQSYLGEKDENGNVTSSGSTTGNEMTQAEINDLVGNITTIVENSMTDEVMTGASQLAVDDLQGQIETLVDEKVTNLSDGDKQIMVQTIEKTILNKLSSSLSDAQNDIDSASEQVTTNKNNITKLITRSSTISTTLKSVNNVLDALTNSYTSSLNTTNSTISGLKTDINANSTKTESNYSSLKDYTDSKYKDGTAYTDKAIKNVETELPTYSYDSSTKTITMSIPFAQ